ncbi:HD-GYP domain-containing protein [Roseiconus nitratireducens]|uniref:HD-GYP domain-containing protein n=1 Tax=Roseiconus nitratireducens TaxID=2605748 RepID=UPI001375C64D|nr:HD domain-containing phosphohydrolase [Roseiconus nitratireducens]
MNVPTSYCDRDAQSEIGPFAATVALADVIAALSYALDITEGQPEGHSTKSCLIAMRIAQEIGLSASDRSALFYGTLLKDAGCSSNAAKVCSLFDADDHKIKQSFKLQDLTRKADAFGYLVRNVATDRSPVIRVAKLAALIAQPGAGKDMIQTRCSRGAEIATKLGFTQATAEAVRALDEHFDGSGEPSNLRGDQIPLLGRIVCLAQTVEVYFTTFGRVAALDVAQQRSGTWFDPELVQALWSFQSDQDFWSQLDRSDARSAIAAFEPTEQRMYVDEDRLDAIAEGFADVIDAKSPWTCRHSFGVAEATVGILKQFGYSDEHARFWRRAALLHDIGKLGVSNRILDKPGKLSEAEFSQMRRHVDHTRRILRIVPCFRNFADVAAAHHEKLDGSGYSLGLSDAQLSREAKAMCVADIFDALAAKRPYRQRQMGLDEVFEIMGKEAGPKICPIAYEALRLHVDMV